jgi:antitoxin component of MazEF toxin-antitoxin module
MNKRTKIIAVNKNTKCVRTVIPNAMAELIDVKAGDEITWKLKTDKNKFYLEVTKVE